MSIVLEKIKHNLETSPKKTGTIIKVNPNGLTVTTSTGEVKIFPYQTGLKINDRVIIGETGLIKTSIISPTKEYEV